MGWKLSYIFLIIIITEAYKYPTKNQPSWLLLSGTELLQENQKPHIHDDKTNNIQIKPHERAVFDSTSNSQEISKQMNKITRQQNFESALGSQVDLRDKIYNNKIFSHTPTVNSYELEIPDHCKQSTYCEDIPNYPHDAINKIIEELGDKINWLPFENVEKPDSIKIDQRVGDAPENSRELCNSRLKKIYPLAAAAPNGKWYTIINRKDNPVQAFIAEVCDSEDSDCSDIIYNQRKYTINSTERTVLGTSCIQKYVPRIAAVLEKVGNTLKMVEKVIDIPSCCSCVAKLAKTENDIS